MSNITRLGLTLCTAALLALSACGGVTGDVRAINLKTGETKSFDHESDVPDGWATCPTPECDVLPPTVPCQNLSGEVCDLNPACRLKVLSCNGGGVVVDGGTTDPAEPQPTDPPEPGPTDFTDPPEPGPTQTCEVICLPKDTVLCEELQDQNQCLANPSCSWMEMCPLMDCAPDSNCPPIPCSGQCVTKAPEACEALDEATCNARPDCNWLPAPCMLCPEPLPGEPVPADNQPGASDGSAPGTDTDFACGECPSFCQPAQQICPTIAYPAPDFCRDGELVPEYDAAGCIVGYRCEDRCPDYPMPMIDCKGGVLEPTYDDRGCQTGWVCKPVTNGCEQLALDYQETLRLAKQCDVSATTPDNIRPCTELVSDALFCPCVTYVNATKTTEIAKLKSLEDEAQRLGCFQNLACPAVACAMPASAGCLASDSSSPNEPPSQLGSCHDY